MSEGEESKVLLPGCMIHIKKDAKGIYLLDWIQYELNEFFYFVLSDCPISAWNFE